MIKLSPPKYIMVIISILGSLVTLGGTDTEFFLHLNNFILGNLPK